MGEEGKGSYRGERGEKGEKEEGTREQVWRMRLNWR